MNARFAFCAKRWLVSAAAGLLLIPPTTVLLRGSTSGSPATAPPRDGGDAVRDDRTAGREAAPIQRVSYTPERRPPRTLGTGRMSAAQPLNRGEQPAARRNRPEQQAGGDGPFAAVLDMFRDQDDPPCLKGNCDLRTDPPQLVPRPQSRYPNPTRRGAADGPRRPVQQIAQHDARRRNGASASRPSSILRELQKLYRRDGIKPPEMDMSKLPETPAEARQAVKERNLQMKKRRSAQQRESSPPGLLQRIFSFGESDERPRTHRPRPIESAAPHGRRGPRPHRPARPGSNLYRRPGSSSQQPARRPRRPADRPSVRNQPPRDWAEFAAEPADSGGDKAAQPDEQGSGASEDPLSEENLFPEMSESEADRTRQNPFTGETLAEDIGDSLKLDSGGAGKAEGESDESRPQGGIARDEADSTRENASPESNSVEAKFRRIASRSGMSGFKGFCPVVLRDRRELVDSNPKFHSRYESRTYHFSSAEAKKTFDSDPEKYAPAYSGKDAVLLAEDDEEVEGSLDYAVWFQDRLYLFSSAETLQQFVLSPEDYAANK